MQAKLKDEYFRMAEVVLLQQGYAREIDSVFHARCSIILLKLTQPVEEEFEVVIDPSLKSVKTILFDAGAGWEAEELSNMIESHGRSMNNVDIVLCSHGHSDHVGGLSLFPDGIDLAIGMN